MTQDELKIRTKAFTIDIIRFVKKLQDGRDARLIGDQLYRSGSSVGANYRAACRSKTKPTFIHKMAVVEEEADECCFWLEIIIDLEIDDKGIAETLLQEARELTAIFTATNKKLYETYKKGKTIAFDK